MIACVIDTSAILAYAFAERGAANVERWIDGGAAASTLTVQEAVSKLCQSGMSRNEAEDLILSLGLVIQDLDLDLAFSAGAMFDLTKPYGLSHGDRACLALGQKLSVPVVTADKAWSKVAADLGLRIEQFR
ncbi:type II toxin-antitoxin system VapC family toxin [Fulvimarina sp. 2208YS6-2-32]|uniref:Type II toxin-antitoxin system VapC family toxin n=1 Tax=Fulvimarina uroteuthidis TaxID=3098149 RepID=A0ABU5I011_9HYPH|nr:type II toxin-antitoxin system VapC family toxin [Fulvimarina sp. 2208YS6-2-32]MDY8108720.1 type II toxin-antitoxin system VapC family toxin [Fulvimarina sp. 2208YS6-2-32]